MRFWRMICSFGAAAALRAPLRAPGRPSGAALPKKSSTEAARGSVATGVYAFLFQPNHYNDLPQAFPGEMIPEDVPAAGAAELRPTAAALAWRAAAFEHAEQPMVVPLASLTFTEEGDVTVA
jgi:hypothetical protein